MHALKPVLEIRRGHAAAVAQPMGTIVRGILHAGSLTLFYGPPKSAKSFLVTHLFDKIADEAHAEWMGHKIVRHGPVLYVACEGHGGFWKRLAAVEKDQGKPLPDNFALATGRPVLLRIDPQSHAILPHPDDVLEAARKSARDGFPPIGVAIDTVFRSFGAGNVSSPTDMTAYLAALAAVMDQGIAMAAVHHEVKAGGTPAGSVALIGGSDTLVRTQRLDGGGYAWNVEMAKDDTATEPRRFDLAKVPVGTDPDGEDQDPCVVRDSEETVKPMTGTKAKKIPAGELKQRWVKEAYSELAADVTPTPGYTAALVRKVAIDDIRELMISRGFLDTEGGNVTVGERTAYKRARQVLMATGTFTADKTHFWRVEPERRCDPPA